MTEEEMKSKWCPHVRYPNLMVGGQVASNVYSDGCNVNSEGNRSPKAFCCIGSDCANWKWDKELLNTEPKADKHAPDQQITSKTHGHCGLIK